MTDQGDRFGSSPDLGGGSPTALRIVVGAEMKRLREACGLTRDAAAEAIRGSESKMSRLETGKVRFKRRDIADLLTMYGVTEGPIREQLLMLADQASEPGWWHRYNDSMPEWLGKFVGLEQAASMVRCYEAQFIPGLLQTEGYARSVIDLGQAVDADEVEQRVALRMRRQQLLDVPQGHDYWAAIDEAALRRSFGGRQVMSDQLDFLLKLNERPNVTLQVVPFERSDAAATGGPFTVLRFADVDLPDIVYVEQLTGAFYLDRRVEVEVYLKVFDRLVAGALTPRRSTALIASVRDDLAK